MTLVISKVFTYDDDAATYIQAVEAADGQALEGATRKAINNFVIGCKQDGIWSAIKASCILAGARTLTGALVPLAGAAPTNSNFVSGDYDRKTGLKGSKNSVDNKFLNTNRLSNADPASNHHFGVYVSSAGTASVDEIYMGYWASLADYSAINRFTGSGGPLIVSSRNNGVPISPFSGTANSTGFVGGSRTSSSTYQAIIQRTQRVVNATEATLASINWLVFSRSRYNGANDLFSDGRLAFYSIGESLDLALLDARVTALINAFAAAIP